METKARILVIDYDGSPEKKRDRWALIAIAETFYGMYAYPTLSGVVIDDDPKYVDEIVSICEECNIKIIIL